MRATNVLWAGSGGVRTRAGLESHNRDRPSLALQVRGGQRPGRGQNMRRKVGEKSTVTLRSLGGGEENSQEFPAKMRRSL